MTSNCRRENAKREYHMIFHFLLIGFFQLIGSENCYERLREFDVRDVKLS